MVGVSNLSRLKYTEIHKIIRSDSGHIEIFGPDQATPIKIFGGIYTDAIQAFLEAQVEIVKAIT
jgi:hypothetical protein